MTTKNRVFTKVFYDTAVLIIQGVGEKNGTWQRDPDTQEAVLEGGSPERWLLGGAWGSACRTACDSSTRLSRSGSQGSVVTNQREGQRGSPAPLGASLICCLRAGQRVRGEA